MKEYHREVLGEYWTSGVLQLDSALDIISRAERGTTESLKRRLACARNSDDDGIVDVSSEGR